MSFSIKLGNFLYKHAYSIYKPMYTVFKNRQDAFEVALLKKHMRPGDVVLDIGANIGFYATIFSKQVGTAGQVHCFEPDPTNFAHLKNSIQGYTNIVINNKAVGPATETLKIYTSKNLNVDHRTYKPEEYDQEFEIDALSIDDYLAAQGGSMRTDVIKMDIQGFEMQAIKGMQKTLNANQNIKLVSEFWPYGLKKAGSSGTEYFNFLSDNGFNCYLIEKDTLQKMDAKKVAELEPLSEEHYFNIFATRSTV